MRDLLEFALLGDLEDVVAAVMQIVAAAAHRAQRGAAGGDAGQRDGFLGLQARWSLDCAHGFSSTQRAIWLRPSCLCGHQHTPYSQAARSFKGQLPGGPMRSLDELLALSPWTRDLPPDQLQR